jgi:uncharacterized membrane protein
MAHLEVEIVRLDARPELHFLDLDLVLIRVAESTDRNEDRADVVRQAEMIVEAASKELACEGDIADVQERYQLLLKKVSESAAEGS